MKYTSIFFALICNLSVYSAEGVTTQMPQEDDTHIADNQNIPFKKHLTAEQKNRIKNILWAVRYCLDRLKIEADNVHSQKSALFGYNYVKELLGEKPVESWKDIDEQWFKWLSKEEYKEFKEKEEALQRYYLSTRNRMRSLLASLRNDLDYLKCHPNSFFSQRDALSNYNLMLELAGEKPVHTWQEIDLEKAESLVPSLLSDLLESAVEFWGSKEGLITVAALTFVVEAYAYIMHKMAVGIPVLIGPGIPGGVPAVAPAAPAA